MFMVGNLLINISFKYVLTWWCWLIWAKFLYRDSWTNILFFQWTLVNVRESAVW